ncbi:ABC transporter ATP-binding protein [Cumulibacter soli]|uniref:ABC transporter ATP-binding protein n=1 Tax=Cumulibacter soli TaxID=2546344 RepID=UPI001067745C|nr:ABC transporter ATP-binding protein [Cumulibacter soli]
MSEIRNDNDRGTTVPILEAENVGRHYLGGRGNPPVIALDQIDFRLTAGQSVGIVGESGSGKTTLLRQLLHLEEPTRGRVLFHGSALGNAPAADRREFHRRVQAVFQDPRSSLNPRMPIWKSITEPATVTNGLNRTQQMELARRLIRSVDLPEAYLARRPGGMSGGECQRVCIARAMSSEPEVIVLDEPVTSLDASLRGLVLNLLRDTAREHDANFIVVSHDVTPIYFLTTYLYVLYQGRVVEEGATQDIVSSPAHPYTKQLIAAVHHPLQDSGDEDPSARVSSGCPFVARCPDVIDPCREMAPALTRTPSGTQKVRCHVYGESPAIVGGRA